jgi:probable phosphoglycerate mutase
LVLVRHGQTPSNVRGVLDTRLPGPELTEKGVRQATALAESLTGEDVVGVYSSVATRAHQTAMTVAGRYDLAAKCVDGLHELQAGDLEGSTEPVYREIFDKIFAQWLDGRLTERLPGGECAQDLLDRFLPGLDRIVATHGSGTVVVVSHGEAIRLAVPALAHNLDRSASLMYVPNCGTVVLETGPGRPAEWRCTTWTGLAG